MGKHRRKYPRELKVELVERVLAGREALEVAKEEDISPDLIGKWKTKENIWRESSMGHQAIQR